MLIHEGTGRVSVALHTDRIAGDAAVEPFVLERAVWIMAVAAAHEPLVHFVMEWLRKSWLYIGVAGVAKLRL